MRNSTITESELYLTFRIDEEMFAINVSHVREVLDLNKITRVPRTLDFMRGVINVRGSVVPVLDLRLKLGNAKTRDTRNTRIIVMELMLDNEPTVLGAIADSVHEVIELEPEHIEPPPKIGKRWRTEIIEGVGKKNEQFIIVIDIDKVFSASELAIVQDAERSDITGTEAENAA